MSDAWARIPYDAIDTIRRIGMTAFCVLAALCRFANRDWEAWPTVATVAGIVGIQERAVRRSLLILESAGLVERREQKGPTGASLPSLYKIIIAPDGEGVSTDTLGCLQGQGRVSQETGEGVPRVLFDNISTRKKNKNTQRGSAANYSSDFERFWTLYPKKAGKRGAYREWKLAIKSTPAETIIEAAERFAASDKGRGAYCWNPQTWLSQGHWEDDPDSWVERNGNGHAVVKQPEREFTTFN